MEGCVLQPPNNRLLSTEVIGDVMQRSTHSRHRLSAYSDDVSIDTRNPPSQRPPLQQRFSHTRELVAPSAGRRDAHQDGTSTTFASRTHYHQSKISSGLNSTTRDMAIQHSTIPRKTTIDKDQVRSMAKLVITEKLRLRELRRVRQIRYRKKKDDYANSLDDENRKLRGEVQQLQRRHRSVIAAIPEKENAWSTVVEYFRLFRFGLSELATTSQSSSPLEMQESAQVDFVRASMAPDVLFNGKRGIKALMKSWCSISSCFASIEMDLDEMKKDAYGSIVATTVTTVTFSKHTLVNLFPHLRRIDECGQVVLSELAEKLVDQKIVMRGLAYFEWDSGYCRIPSIQDQSDMLTPMLRVLGTLENVWRVFDKALITPDFHSKQKTNTNVASERKP